MSGNRRQYYLLAVLGVAVLAWFRFGGASVGPSGGGGGPAPAIDATGLINALKNVSTVNPAVAVVIRGDSAPDRNLFQYGERKPPPPPPLTEAERKQAEEALRAQEAAARAAAAQAQQVQEAQAEAARLAAEEAARQQQAQAELAKLQPPKPVEPPRPVAPQINFKFMGVIGPAKRKVGIFLEGDKMLLARKGEVLDGRFRILEIGPEWAEVGYVDPIFKDQKQQVKFGQ